MHPQNGNGFSLILGNILELFADGFATATFLSFSLSHPFIQLEL